MTEYIHMAVIICLDKEFGNELAHMARASDTEDAERGTFTDARITEPLAYYAEVPCKSSLAGVIQALKEDASIDDERLAYMVQRGLTDETWAHAKSLCFADVYQYIVDGQVQRDPAVLESLAAENGFVIVEQSDE
jgi:hypothetical protein